MIAAARAVVAPGGVLALARSSYVTGQIVGVDGGLSIAT